MRIFLTFFILIAAFLSLGTVVERKSAIQRTQTDPIAYEEKKKEEKEGKKGPPVPSFRLFPREKFLIEGPIGKGKPEAIKEERVTEEELEDWDFWFEEENDAPKTPLP